MPGRVEHHVVLRRPLPTVQEMDDVIDAPGIVGARLFAPGGMTEVRTKEGLPLRQGIDDESRRRGTDLRVHAFLVAPDAPQVTRARLAAKGAEMRSEYYELKPPVDPSTLPDTVLEAPGVLGVRYHARSAVGEVFRQGGVLREPFRQTTRGYEHPAEITHLILSADAPEATRRAVVHAGGVLQPQ